MKITIKSASDVWVHYSLHQGGIKLTQGRLPIEKAILNLKNNVRTIKNAKGNLVVEVKGGAK